MIAGFLLLGRLLTLPAIIRLGWKGLLGTNTLAYYESSKITDRKSFIALGPGNINSSGVECSKFLADIRKFEIFHLTKASLKVHNTVKTDKTT
jgi:hypothetical protein